MGILSGLSKMGLGGLEEAELYKKEEKASSSSEANNSQAAPKKVVNETDFIFDKKYECPVCYHEFKEKKVKTGKARLVSQDKDLRPVYADIDPGKYDVISCPNCGYSALERWYQVIAAPQAKLIKENISRSFKRFSRGETVSYEEAIERYKLTLANCIVKKGKDSEKAYVCLKLAWIVRGYAESLNKADEDYEAKLKELKADEKELLHNALEGFIMARENETPPIAGLDEVQLDYLLAVLSLEEDKTDDAARFIMHVLQSRNASARIKNKALEIKEEIIEKKKNEA